MKVTIIGAGSYVFAPTILADAIEKHRASDLSIAFVDVNPDSSKIMARLAERMAADCGITIRTACHEHWRSALPASDFVVLCAAVQGMRRWQMDREILIAAGMVEQDRECGGMGGLIHSLRSCTLVLDVTRDMRELCPDAWLLDVTNPMPRVVTAAVKYGGIKTLGFCNIAYAGAEGYDGVARLVERNRQDIDVITTGLNHFAWLTSVVDRATGEDLLGLARQNVLAWADRNEEYSTLAAWLKKWDSIGVSSAEHMGEYLPPRTSHAHEIHAPYHGDAQEREQRRAALANAAEGKIDWRPVIHNSPSWEHPIDVAIALHTGSTLAVDIVNFVNAGSLPQLPAGSIIEAPATVEHGEIRPAGPILLPEKTAEICRQVGAVHELIAEATAKGAVDLLHQAVDIDPAVPESSKADAHAVLPVLIKAHLDVIPQFAKAF